MSAYLKWQTDLNFCWELPSTSLFAEYVHFGTFTWCTKTTKFVIIHPSVPCHCLKTGLKLTQHLMRLNIIKIHQKKKTSPSCWNCIDKFYWELWRRRSFTIDSWTSIRWCGDIVGIVAVHWRHRVDRATRSVVSHSNLVRGGCAGCMVGAYGRIAVGREMETVWSVENWR
jgi:hypothetical protein